MNYEEGEQLKKEQTKRIVKIVIWAFVAIFIISWVSSFAGKSYDRYQARLDAQNQVTVEGYNVQAKELQGKASLESAKWSTQVATEQARAQLEAEKLNAQAEVERAKGAAEAIRIEGGSLTTEYIQYLWVRQNQFNDKTTIYIPTEANLPVLEASRLNN